MPEQFQAQDRTFGANSVRIRAVTTRSILRLKAWASGLAQSGPKLRIAGLDLPWEVGVTVVGELRALCTGPSDWLLVAPGPLSSPARDAIDGDSARQELALVDLSSGLSVLEVSGPGTRDVLAKGCGLDLDPRQFPADRCTRTRLAQIAMAVDFVQAPDRYELYVARSFRTYLNDWLADSVIVPRPGGT